eukprot:2812017-Rhodomonas_salina.1
MIVFLLCLLWTPPCSCRCCDENCCPTMMMGDERVEVFFTRVGIPTEFSDGPLGCFAKKTGRPYPGYPGYSSYTGELGTCFTSTTRVQVRFAPVFTDLRKAGGNEFSRAGLPV